MGRIVFTRCRWGYWRCMMQVEVVLVRCMVQVQVLEVHVEVEVL